MNKFVSTLSLTTATALTLALVEGLTSSYLVLGQTSIDLDTLRNTFVSKHNSYRATHSSPNLTISDNLNSMAQDWADTLASRAEFKHSPNSGNVGENIYVSGVSKGGSIDSTTLANQAVEGWYSESKDYDYSNPGFSSKAGHFTQIVWKSSTEIGCGAAQGSYPGRTDFTAYYVVCQYAPGGNVSGQFPDNVLQPQ